MSVQVHRPPRTTYKSEDSPPMSALRLPEERAFDVATINGRLARMAERASPRQPLQS